VTRSVKLLSVTVFLVFSVCLLPLTDAATGVVDQKQEYPGNVWRILSDAPIGQEFVPSLSPLIGVDVYIDDLDVSGDDTLILNIRQGTITNPILGTVSQSVHQGLHAWIHYDLSSPLSVTVGSTYVLELTATTDRFGWAGGALPNLYPLGSAILSGVVDPTVDFAFRTYAPSQVSPPVGGFMQLANKLAVFAPYLALFAVVASVAVVFWKRPDN